MASTLLAVDDSVTMRKVLEITFAGPDFRVVTPQARFTANFVKLGFHPGFALTYILPRIIGHQRANLLFLTGRRIDGRTALEWEWPIAWSRT